MRQCSPHLSMEMPALENVWSAAEIITDDQFLAADDGFFEAVDTDGSGSVPFITCLLRLPLRTPLAAQLLTADISFMFFCCCWWTAVACTLFQYRVTPRLKWSSAASFPPQPLSSSTRESGRHHYLFEWRQYCCALWQQSFAPKCFQRQPFLPPFSQSYSSVGLSNRPSLWSTISGPHHQWHCPLQHQPFSSLHVFSVRLAICLLFTLSLLSSPLPTVTASIPGVGSSHYSGLFLFLHIFFLAFSFSYFFHSFLNNGNSQKKLLVFLSLLFLFPFSLCPQL